MRAARRLTLILAVAGSVMVALAPVRGSRAPRHVALLVGIADYEVLEDTALTSGPNGSLTDLLGPEDDVRRVRASLLQWGFTDSSNIKVLMGRNATKQGIAQAFRWLRERANDSADVVVLYYSGHGTSVRDENGDESDGRDEAIVPYDARNFREPSQVVTDDSLGAWLGALQTRNVTMIVDACYSGTITRAEPVGRAKGLALDTTGPIDDAVMENGAHRLGHTLITASRSFELAREIEFPRGSNRWHGAMTYHLTRIIDGASASRGLRYDELIGALRQAVAGEGLSQVPQVEGDSTSPLFRSNVGVASRSFALVTSQNGNDVSLGVGAVNGVRVSAIYDVYGAGETRFAGGRLARIRIQRVGDTVSLGRIVAENGEDIQDAARLPAGARAALSIVPLGAASLERLKVHIAASARADFAAALPHIDTARVELVRDASGAHATVTKDRGVIEVSADGADLPPQPVREGTIPRVITGADTVSGYSPSSLCDALTRAFSVAKLQALENPSPPRTLQAYVRVVPSGARPPFDTRHGSDTVRLNSSAARASVDVYALVNVPAAAVARTRLNVSAAVAGFVSAPQTFWPRRGEANPFPLNSWQLIWRAVSVEPPFGRELIKLVVNSDQYDLRSLENSANICRIRAPGAGAATRDAGDGEPITGWTAVSHALHIVRDEQR